VLWAWAVAVVARPVFLAVAAAAMVIVLFAYQTVIGGVRERTFFGSYEVRVSADRHTLTHGTTLHGFQLSKYPRAATSYYAQTGPLGDVFGAYQAQSDRVAVVGLGAGTVAAYGRAGQRFDFYEIDPAVVKIARNPRYFTYLRDCACQVRTVVGDGRLRLDEAPDGSYGLMVLDAFSSDAVPAHLLTREALALYMRKLRPGGILAFHISNRHLDLAPMLGATARAEGLATRTVLYQPLAKNDFALATHWVAIGRTEADLGPLQKRNAGWSPIPPGGPVWTDNYSALFEILKLS
jgi:SAM-dependent methyltransferase